MSAFAERSSHFSYHAVVTFESAVEFVLQSFQQMRVEGICRRCGIDNGGKCFGLGFEAHSFMETIETVFRFEGAVHMELRGGSFFWCWHRTCVDGASGNPRTRGAKAEWRMNQIPNRA